MTSSVYQHSTKIRGRIYMYYHPTVPLTRHSSFPHTDRGPPFPPSLDPRMARSLKRRIRYVERMGEHSAEKRELPWLKHKWFLLKLWTGAYMLDSWEVVAVFAAPALALIALVYYVGR